MSDFTFQDDAEKDAGDTLPFKLELGNTDLVAFFWESDEQYALNEAIRPSVPNGFAMRCVSAGTSGAEEPTWPTTLNDTVADGSVTWKAIAAALNGVATITSPTYEVSPTGLTVDGLSAEEGTSIVGEYVGGDMGKDYEVKFSFLVNGKPRVARHVVKIRKQ